MVTTPHSGRPAPSAAQHFIQSIPGRALLAVVCFLVGLGLYAWLRPLELLAALIQIKFRLDGIHSEYVNVDGYRIHYFRGGSGEPIVLVHGLGGRSEDWINLMPQLVRGGRRVYALDLLGYGRSARPRDAAYSIPEEAGIVEKFIATQHLGHSDLAGWSMGGWVALRVALDQPALIRRLIVYDSAGLRFTLPFDIALFWPEDAVKLAKLNDLLSPGHGPQIPTFIQDDFLRSVRRNGWVPQRSAQSMLTGQDLLDGKLSQLKIPLLIVWGRQDQITPLSVGYAIHAETPQSVLEIYDGCGHLAPRDCTDRIGANTLRFLKAEPPLAPQVIEIPKPAGK